MKKNKMYSIYKHFRRLTLSAGKILPALVLPLAFIAAGCGEKLPVEKDLKNYSFPLINEDSSRVVFPQYLKGKIVVMGYIFTNCPDICPMTTHNMQTIRQEAEKQGLKDVTFVSLTFDPKRDTPSILRQFAGVRGIDLNGWDFLTGRQEVIDSMKKAMNFVAAAGDTSYTEDGMPYYFFVHTDRISLIDQEGKIRKNYKGSRIDINEIIKDIKTIED